METKENEKKQILTEHEKEVARQTSLEVLKTILTLGFNHLLKWLAFVIKKK